MNATDFIICCRKLVGALRQTPHDEVRPAFVLGFDASGLPFYKTCSSGEPLFFCPFCGRRVREGGDPAAAAKRAALGRARVAVVDEEEELTRPALEWTREVETAVAPRGAYFSDFTSAGLVKSDSGTGALNSTFS